MIVGWDTATSATAAAALGEDGAAFEHRDDPEPGERPRHGGRLLELIEAALAEAGGTWADVERLAVGRGPGGFTGLRIGIATARALAQAHGIPVAGVSSLQALAGGVSTDTGAAAVLAVIDARRGEAFAAAWGPDGTQLAPAAALRPAALGDLAVRLPGPPLAIGDGAIKFRVELERSGALVPPDGSPVHRVSAVQVCRLGATGDPTARDALVPDYRREPDATPRQP